MSSTPEKASKQNIGELYRSVANEKPPAHLDRRVLRRAARAARPKQAPWSWLRPVAAATVVGISLVFVAGQYDLWTQTPPAGDNAGVVQDFDDAARESTARFREFGDTVTPQTLNPDSLPADTYKSAEPTTSRYCREEQIAGRHAWEACISVLHRSGSNAEANEEQRKLRAAFANGSQ